MTKTISFDNYKVIISESLGIDIKNLKSDTSFIDLGIDSLSLVNFVIRLEKMFNIKINIENVWALKNIEESYYLLMQRLESREVAGKS